MNYRDYFNGKKITLMGLGLLGRGVGDAAFLAKCGAQVLVTDKKSAKELAPSVERLKRFSNIRCRLGGHDKKDFRNAEMVLKAAGVPLDSPYIKMARKNKVPVYMSTALFVKLLPPNVTVIGVTGTRGKTTTSFMIYEIIKQFSIFLPAVTSPQAMQAGNFQFSKRPNVHLGGNIQGVSTLAMLPKIKSGDFVVLELDSWQLQGFRDLKVSPHVAVFSTFFPDHMNYYGGDMKKYFADKAAIFTIHDTHSTVQKKNVFIVGEQAMSFVKKYSVAHAKRAVVARANDVPKNWKLKILGEHNRSNAACAIAVADALGVPRVVTKKAVENFLGVPGRLELMREVRGVKIYNDTTATTPEATIAALRALIHKSQITNHKQIPNLKSKTKKNIVLIMGGADKGLDMRGLVREIPKHCKAVVLLAGTGSKKFSIFLPAVTSRHNFADVGGMQAGNFQFSKNFKIQNSKFTIFEAKTLKEAVKLAFEMTERGDIVLFSPAFASFGMFKNEYHRGEQFNRLIENL